MQDLWGLLFLEAGWSAHRPYFVVAESSHGIESLTTGFATSLCCSSRFGCKLRRVFGGDIRILPLPQLRPHDAARRSGRLERCQASRESIERDAVIAIRQLAVVVAVLALVGSIGLLGARHSQTAAQEATPAALAGHSLVGSWIVDTDIATGSDLPEIGIFTSDGTVFGLGATRWVSGAWEATDDSTGLATMVGVFAADGGGSVVLRGFHQVDETGNAWTCECTFTLVAPDGSVVTSGSATAHATRLPVESVDAAGSTLPDFPTWVPADAATPAPVRS